MTMTLKMLSTYWTPAQPCEILTLLDELRDQLRETHGARVIGCRLNKCTNVMPDVQQQSLNFEDEPF